MNEYIQAVRQRNAGRTLRAAVVTFGCQQNEADSEKLRGMAAEMGYAITEHPADADLIVVNTCAIREHAEQKALSTIGQYKHLKAKKSDLIIAVCGCMTAQAHRVEELKNSYPYVDFTFAPSALDRFPEYLCEVLDRHGRSFHIGEAAGDIREGVPILRNSSTKAWVSIMYGCNNFCSYCIVPYVRDRERSRDFRYVLEEVRDVVAAGAKDVTLLGQNVNSFAGGCSFAELIGKISDIDGNFRLRFMTSHPKDVSDELIAAMAKSRNIAHHFHLPLQSGSDAVLKAMNRHYDRAHYLSVADKLRAAMPDIALTTDIIVGFPGETEEDFEATLDILRRVRFDMIYSFIYSPRSGTPAARMENQVPDDIKSARMQRLLEVQDEISYAKNCDEVGKTLRVLADGASKNDPAVYAGRSEAGKLVHFRTDADVTGQFVNVHITRAEPFCLHGELEK